MTGARRWTAEYIERRAEGALRHFLPATLTRPTDTPVLQLALAVKSAVGVDFVFDQPLGRNARGQHILGACQFSPRLAVFIDPSLASDPSRPRFRFALAHELGHLSLHRKLSLDFTSLDATQARIDDGRHDMRIGRKRLESTRDLLEWQANRYAAALLMPAATFAVGLRDVQESIGVRRLGHMFVDDQPDNVAIFRKTLDSLAALYRTSATAARIRLEQLDLLTDNRSPTRSGQPVARRGSGPVIIGEILRQLIEQ